MDQQMKVGHSVDERKQLWRIDHQEFPVCVLPSGRSSKPVKPWVTTLIDDATRVILSVLVTVERPDATSVGVALADGMRPKSTTLPGVTLSGVPLALLNDNGGEFRSDQVLGMLKRPGIASMRTYPYMKHLNGKAERVQQTIQHELAHRLPGWAHGPKTLKLKDLYGFDGALMSEELLTEMILDWVDTYNGERPHTELDGATPLQGGGAALPGPCGRHGGGPPGDNAGRQPRKVTADGISLRGQLYTSGELAQLRLVGRQVDVRYLPHDASFIEVFDGDTWLCTCVPVDKVDPEGLELMAQVRKEQYTTARAYQDAARERRELAVATATPERPALLPLSTPRAASAPGRRHRGGPASRQSRAAPAALPARPCRRRLGAAVRRRDRLRENAGQRPAARRPHRGTGELPAAQGPGTARDAGCVRSVLRPRRQLLRKGSTPSTG